MNFKTNTTLFLFLLINIAIYASTDTIPHLVYVDSFGNVGLGTSLPAAKLDVRGSANFSSTINLNNNPGLQNQIMTSLGENANPIWKDNLWMEDSLRIKHLDKEVMIGKTLINIGDYTNDSTQNYFNLWRPNILNAIDLPPFTFTGGAFANPIPNEQPLNYVYNFGSNLNSGGGLYQEGSPGYGLGFEDRFYIGNEPHSEFHVLAVDKYGIQRRPVTFAFNHNGTSNEMTNFLSKHSFLDYSGKKLMYSFDTETEKWDFYGSELRHIFNTADYQPIWQNDGSGTIFPLIGYKNSKLQLGNPTGLTKIGIGQGIEIGNDGSFDYIGSALGDGANNFSIGTNGKRYNTIWFKTNFEVISRYTNIENPEGWGIAINNSGGLYLHDYKNNASPFYLSGNMPSNSFHMNASGNVCIGCLNADERLKINGNLFINGTLKFANQPEEAGQILVSDGTGNEMVWSKNITKRIEVTFICTEGQTQFALQDIIESPLDNEIPIGVFKNGIKLKYTTASNLTGRQFNYDTNIVTIPPATAGDEIEITYFK